MEAEEYDFYFPRGDTCPVVFTITAEDGSELDLSKAELYFTMKKNYTTSDYVVQKRLSNSEFTVDGDQVSFTLKHEDTAKLSYGRYKYDIQFVSGDYYKTLVIGEIELTNESTHIANE